MKRKETIKHHLIEETTCFLQNINEPQLTTKSIEKKYNLTAATIAKKLGLARYNVSRDLNQLIDESKVIKINGRPVIFVSKKELESKLEHQLNVNQFENLSNFEELFSKGIQTIPTDYPFTELIGYDGSLSNAIRQAKAALLYPPSGLHTLLTGPSGSGKTTFARFMYQYAMQNGQLKKNAPYIVFNCADYSNNQHLLLDQLFGHVKQAFTGADSDKSGLVEEANNGILFLDEIHRLPPEGQEMLFSIIDRGEFYRLGESSKTRKVNVLIIGATTENIQENILTTFLRRIPLTITLPSMDERSLMEKIQLIYFCFKQEAKNIVKVLIVNEDVIRFFLQYTPVGNIGQLKNDIQLLCANALVDNLSTRTQKIHVKLSHLSPYLIDQFYYTRASESVNHEMRKKLKLLKIEEFIFSPDENKKESPLFLVDEENNLSNNVADMYKKYLDGQDVLSPLRELIHGKEKQLALKQTTDQQPIFKIVSRKNFEITLSILKRIAQNERYYLDESNIKSLALHLDTLVEKIAEGYSFRNDTAFKHKNKQDVENSKEFQMAKQVFQEISDKLQVELPKSEVYFISLYLKAMNEKYKDKKIGVLVLMHGSSAATDLAKTANELLDVNHAVGINMPLSQSVGETLEKVTEVVQSMNEGKGVVILSDMGSLNMFGEIITKKTGIQTETIKMVTTPMVIEATRKSLLPQMSLENLIEDIVEQSSYIGNSVEEIQEKQESTTLIDIEQNRRSKIICILEESLNFLDGTTIFDALEVIAKNIFNQFPIESFDNFWIKFLFHTSSMLERAIRKEQFYRNDVNEYILQEPRLYQFIKESLIPLENRFAIEISDSEITYLMEVIDINMMTTHIDNTL